VPHLNRFLFWISVERRLRKLSSISKELSVVHELSNTTSQCCCKPLYLQITLLISHRLYGPCGYVDHSVVHANGNEGIQGSWFTPVEHSGFFLFWMQESGTPRAYSVCLSSWKPRLLDPSPGSCQPSSSSWRRIPSLHGSLPLFCFLNTSLDSLIHFLCYSTSFADFPSRWTLSLAAQEIYNFHKREDHQIVMKTRTRWFTGKL